MTSGLISSFKIHFLPDEESPLYEFSARDISSKMQFEIILTVEGITPETGNTIQVRGRGTLEVEVVAVLSHPVRTL